MRGKVRDRSKVWLSFSISNFKCDAGEISRGLQLKPSRVLLRGELYPNSRAIQNINLWNYRGRGRGINVQRQVDLILEDLRYFSRIRKIIRGSRVRLTAVIEISIGDQIPVISVNADSMLILGKMGVDFEVDYYLIGGE